MAAADIDAVRSIPFDVFISTPAGSDNAMQIHVDRAYVEKVRRITTAGIRNLRYKVFTPIHPMLHPLMSEVPEIRWPTMNRANNLTGKNFPSQPISKDKIKCHRIRNNVLLPNGDVFLCCNDYGLKTLLGKLAAGRIRRFAQKALNSAV